MQHQEKDTWEIQFAVESLNKGHEYIYKPTVFKYQNKRPRSVTIWACTDGNDEKESRGERKRDKRESLRSH